MSKDKKRDESKKPKKITVEAEVSLLGLLLSIVSLIALLNQGWLGSFLTYCFVYLFGSMYYVILLLNIYLGMYLFIKKKKPTFVIGINALACILFMFFILIAASKFDNASLSSWYTHFINNFEKAKTSKLAIDPSKIYLVGGGLVGYGMYTLLVSLMGEFVTIVVIILVLLGCFYILFKKPLIFIFNKIVILIKKIKVKLQKSKEKENTNNVEEMKNDVVTSKDLSFEFSNAVKKEGLSFDIFHEPIFDEETIAVNNSNVINNSDIDDNDCEEERIEEEIIVKNDDVNFSEEGLEFFGEESIEEVDVPSEPLVNAETKIVTQNDIRDIDVYDLLNDNNENNAYNELKDEVEMNCERINQKLNELNIKAKVNDYIIGPCVTRYEIVPEIGVRVSSIVNIENDLKLALAAIKTRMEAPIPGKSAVGIEVANKKRYPVYLKEVIYPYREDTSKLLVGIGRDLNNKEVVLNIDKMPHLLVAGATGSGKSVCINSMITSLLLRTTPDEVKMILIDPKKVEMLPYANMPHLLCPVVIDPKKASVALKKVVKEMDRRYDEFANNGVRNIEGYNKLKQVNGESLLPNIVVIIDELADLMLVAAKEVEESIQRITQLARAAGIYLIVATQRPSVDVITGVIKANIPSRIAFAVSSQVDSRTIIDRGGAEELLGKGDMLMDISGSGTLSRVQGVFVSDEEIFNIVNYVKSKYSVNYDNEFLNLEEEKKEEINNLMINDDTNNDDKLYEDIKDFVIRNKRASTSLIQRYFTLGYARAARMMDRLESEGIISEANGAKPREVLVDYKKENDTNE